MSLCTLTRIVVWCARRLDRSIFMSLKIIRNRKFEKEFKNDILYNSLFNLLFSLVNSFSLLSLCIFEGTSFWLKRLQKRFDSLTMLYYLCAARLELAVTFCFVASQLSHRQSPCMFLEKLNKMNRRKYF